MFFRFRKSLVVLSLPLFFLTNFNTVNAQCFEIESILVDACGNPEGENEMVRFKVGTTSLNTANISVNWASANTWLGICQNGASSNATNSLNATITGCGLLVEPTGGVLPANASILFLTSTAIDVSANSFANLNDTLFVIFQCAGNTGGHFANYNTSPGLRTLSISFSSPSGCNDVVTYDRTMLVNQNGTTGGSTALKNGASVNFDPAGNPSYFNNGCQAPFNPTDITAAILPSSSLTICPGDSINLFGTLTGPIDSVLWSGGFGSFNNPKNDTTTYFSSINDTLPFYIKINGATTCSAGVSDSVLINIIPKPNISILNGTLIDICNGTPITLNANGATNYLWSTGETTSSINVSIQNNYFVTDTSNHCYSDTAFIQVNNITPSATISGDTNLCIGSSIILTANGIGNFSWSNGDTGNSTIISSGQQITLTATNSCGNQAFDVLTITEEDCSIETGIIIPNVFTPNGDNFNDIFKVEGTNITSIIGTVYDRWGLLLFEWSGIDNGWDGKDYNEGTYFYIIKATFRNEKTEEFKGAILLLK